MLIHEKIDKLHPADPEDGDREIALDFGKNSSEKINK